MCGIIGFSGRYTVEALRAGTRAISHRGPDDSGVFFDAAAEIGLGHTRLSIIDLSPLGHQPMEALEGRVGLVFNGEIYNYRELRTELEAKGHSFLGQSDTEVVLRLWIEEGERMLPKLNGIFGLAIWDARVGSTLVARDALGVKPLYIAETPRGVAYSSEIKGILELDPGLRELDPRSIVRYLNVGWCPGDGTPFRAVRKLLPGELVELRHGRIARRVFWYHLPAAQGKLPDLDERGSVEGIVPVIRSAVHRQMVADVPVGAFLSGGLDSSSVVCLAREIAPDLECFTIRATGGVERGVADDLPYAQRVARHLGVPLRVVETDSDRMIANFERMIWQLDEPLADPAPLNVLYISELARSSGIKVLLSGAGGDDIFSGYPRHVALDLDRYWSLVPRPLRAALESLSGRLDQRRPLSRRVTRFMRGAGLSGDARMVGYFAWTRERPVLDLLSKECRREVGSEPVLFPMLQYLAAIPSRVEPLERMLALEQRFFLADHNLIYTDKMSMATGVEVRVPLLDLEVVDFAARIPSRFKQNGRVGKWVFKKAMEPYLPHDVIYRPKTGFGAPFRRWLRGELRPLIEDMLGRDSINRRGLFEADAVANLLRANHEGRIEASYVILGLLGIEIWCRQFVDRRGASSPGGSTGVSSTST